MNILEITPALGRPRGASEWTWSCWGESAHYVDWGGEENHIASAVFDLITGEIYCLELYTGTQAIRYLLPEMAEDYRNECIKMGVDFDQPAPGIEFITVDNPQDVLTTLATLNDITR
jgi:hypothetical protein